MYYACYAQKLEWFKDYQYYAVSKRERTLPDMVFFRYNLF